MARERRSLVDRLLRPVHPSPVASFAPPPLELAPGVWGIERRLRIPPGLTLPTRMTVLGLAGGGLLLHSPVSLDPATRDAVRALGAVEAILAPNSFHYVFARPWLEAFPSSRFLVAPGLPERIDDLPPGERVPREGSPFGPGIAHLVLGPIRGLSEVVLLHRPSRTLVLTDLAFHWRRFESPAQRLLWRLNGVPAGFGPSRSVRWTLLADRAAAAPFLGRIADWDFDRILVAHGDPIEANGRDEFRRAFRRYLV
jgi:hypothetical protein